jgi:hypothetical protein
MVPDISIIKEVIFSWQVIVAAIFFIVFWEMVSSIVNPRKKITFAKKPKKLARPAEAKSEIDSSVDTEELGLGE